MPLSKKSRHVFSVASQHVARASGTPGAFVIAVSVVAMWALSGPLFGFSDTWQLIINTSTTIVTFLMVFLIQNTQNRDSEAMHLKLDELIRAVKGANNAMLDLEELEADELDRVRTLYDALARKARAGEQHGKSDPAVVASQLGR